MSVEEYFFEFISWNSWISIYVMGSQNFVHFFVSQVSSKFSESLFDFLDIQVSTVIKIKHSKQLINFFICKDWIDVKSSRKKLCVTNFIVPVMVNLIHNLVYLLFSSLFIVLESTLENFLQHDFDLISAKTSASISVKVLKFVP